MDKVYVTDSGNGLFIITLNRPEKRNAVDYDVMDQLNRLLDELSDREDCKMLAITGAGTKAFCSGGDLSVFHELHTKEDAYGMLSKMGKILYKLLTFKKPTVALINGTAMGGGCEIATACDYRLSSSNAKMGFVQGKLGITTGWGGGVMLLEKLGYERALNLLMKADTFTAMEGRDSGFIHEVYDAENLHSSLLRWAEPYLRQSSAVLSAYKQTATKKWATDSFKQRFFEEIEQCAVLWESDEHHDAVARFINPSTS